MYILSDSDRNKTKCPTGKVLKISVVYSDGHHSIYYSKDLRPGFNETNISFINIDGLKQMIVDCNVYQYTFDHITEDEMKKEIGEKDGTSDQVS